MNDDKLYELLQLFLHCTLVYLSQEMGSLDICLWKLPEKVACCNCIWWSEPLNVACGVFFSLLTLFILNVNTAVSDEVVY